MDIGFVEGLLVGPLVCAAFVSVGKAIVKRWATPEEAPPPSPPRDIGDLLKHPKSGLPVLLLEQLTYDMFRGCFITPRAQHLGALVGTDPEKPVDELEPILLFSVSDPTAWSNYDHKLSDGEHVNYTKAMLTDKKGVS